MQPDVKHIINCTAELKAVNEDNGYLEGYANVFNVVDSYGDRTLPGAFAQDINEFIQKGYLAIDHEWEIKDGAIGDIIEAREDANGLWFRAKFYSTDCSQRIRTKLAERLANGKEIGLSIGYFVVDAEMVTENGESIRLLKRLVVKEVSPVFCQANEPSMVTNVKNAPKLTLDDHWSAASSLPERLKTIDDLGRSDGWKQTQAAALRDLSQKCIEAAESLEPETKQETVTYEEAETAMQLLAASVAKSFS